MKTRVPSNVGNSLRSSFARNFWKTQKASFWVVLYGLLVLYVFWRMQGFALWRAVGSPQGFLQLLPNTFASVDHPFHVARAEILWRELSAGHLLRWIGQHQGGYPAEFYPLGQAWFEVIIRTLSFGLLPPEGAHTLAVVTLFLLPGVAFAALAREDGFPPAVALLALSLQIALPGGWYGGGYTELVQWGLITNVAGATATILALPAMVIALSRRSTRAVALAAVLAAIALYSNPRSAVGLVAIGIGALVATNLAESWKRPKMAIRQLTIIAIVTALLAAPLLISLGRYGQLYSFVHYSDYATWTDYLSASRNSTTGTVLLLGMVGLVAGLWRGRLGTRATAASAAVFILATMTIAFVPIVDAILPQLEPTRLMPLQRFLLLYLASGTIWTVVSELLARFTRITARTGTGLILAVSFCLIAILTRPVYDAPLDPASPEVPPVSLYPVEMSAQRSQASLRDAVLVADREGDASTAILVLGSELSWHQQLWTPLWTERPLYFDNWLWYWHPMHAGTPGYEPFAGHHYPDPEATLTRDYLSRYGIGAVVASRAFRDLADNIPFLARIGDGEYSTYLVESPSPTVTFDRGETTFADIGNALIEARSSQGARQAEVRMNWFPRWTLQEEAGAVVGQSDDWTMRVTGIAGATGFALEYAVEPLDWLARAMAVIGVFVVGWLWVQQIWAVRPRQSSQSRARDDA